MKINYGNIEAEVSWIWPTKEVYEDWKKDFLKIEEVKFFDIYLVGGFLEKLNGKKKSTPDVDIILIGDKRIKEIEKVISEGTRIGMEKYNMFVDILWFDKMFEYDKEEVLEIETCLLSDKWIVNDKIEKQYKEATQISENLWEMSKYFPNAKQMKLLREGYIYCKPLKISSKRVINFSNILINK